MTSCHRHGRHCPTRSSGFSSDDEFFRGSAGGASSKNSSVSDPRRCRSAALRNTSSAEVWFLDQLPPTSDSTRRRTIPPHRERQIRSPHRVATARRGLRSTVNTPRYHDKTGEDPPTVEQPTEPAEQGHADNGGPGRTSADAHIGQRSSTSTRAHRHGVEERGE